jgi:hypothetical protein
MNAVFLMKGLKGYTEELFKNKKLSVRMQRGDDTQIFRAPQVYMMRLPDSASATKKAPYILHQLIKSESVQSESQLMSTSATIRTIFCVYSDNEEEGAMQLLELIEEFKIALIMNPVINEQFLLDTKRKIEYLIYPEDTAPYYCGEMVSEWILPSVQREVQYGY